MIKKSLPVKISRDITTLIIIIYEIELSVNADNLAVISTFCGTIKDH
jgi:hypothetical protein